MSESSENTPEQLPALPPGWCWCPVGQLIADIEAGVSFKCLERPPEPHEVGVLKVSAVTWGEYDESESKTCTDSKRVDDSLFVRPGDLLFSRANTIQLIGACVIANNVTKRIMLSDKILRLRVHSGLEQWLLWALRTPWARRAIERLASGNQESMRNIGQERLRQIPVPLAPPRQIPEIRSALEAAITKLTAAETSLARTSSNLKRYRASVLKAAVEGRLVPTEAELARSVGRNFEPASVLLDRILDERRHRWEEAELAKMKAKGTIPNDDKWKARYSEPAEPHPYHASMQLPSGWCWASLDALTSAVRPITYGILMPKDHIEDGVPYVKVRDMKSGRLTLGSLQRTAPEIAAQYPRSVLRGGDLLLAIRGTFGRIVDIPPELTGGNITQDSARLDVTPLVSPRFVKQFIESPWIQKYFEYVARGVAVKGVNLSEVRATPIPLPPLSEQERITSDVERFLSIVEPTTQSVVSQRARTKNLRREILRWAFEGKLVDQDPNDEPASVLLERIRAEREAAHAARPRPGRKPRTSVSQEAAPSSPKSPSLGKATAHPNVARKTVKTGRKPPAEPAAQLALALPCGKTSAKKTAAKKTAAKKTARRRPT